MFCRDCGSENRNDSKFCTNCGKPMKDYTKPVENVIMPDDIKQKQEAVKNQNHTIKKLTIVMYILFIAGIALLVGGFFIDSNVARIVLMTLGFVLITAGLATMMLKGKKIENLNNINKD